MSEVNRRKHFGSKQVRTLKGLKIGKRYTHLLKSVSEFYTITSKVKTAGIFGDIFLYVNSVDNNNYYQLFLGDVSIIPYSNGSWNPTNYLKRI